MSRDPAAPVSASVVPEIPRSRARSVGRILGWLFPLGAFLAGQAYLLLWLGVWAGASIPAKDAPPEVILREQLDLEASWQGVRGAAFVSVVSCVWLAVKVIFWLRARARRGAPSVSASPRDRGSMSA